MIGSAEEAAHDAGGQSEAGSHGRVLAVTRLAVAGLAVTGLAVSALAVAALAVTGLAVTALAVTGLAVAGLAVAALAVAGLAVAALAVTGLAVAALAVTALAVLVVAAELAVLRRGVDGHGGQSQRHQQINLRSKNQVKQRRHRQRAPTEMEALPSCSWRTFLSDLRRVSAHRWTRGPASYYKQAGILFFFFVYSSRLRHCGGHSAKGKEFLWSASVDAHIRVVQGCSRVCKVKTHQFTSGIT